MKTQLTIIFCAIASLANAKLIQLGEATFTGNFTINHSFDFNNPSAQPFGSFGVMTATDASGIFNPYVQAGSTLEMNTPNLWSLYGNANNPQMVWSNGGFTFSTYFDLMTGSGGLDCTGLVNMTGNGFDPEIYGLGANVSWNFLAPPDTGPITLTVSAIYHNGHLPDNDATIALLFLGWLCLMAMNNRKAR